MENREELLIKMVSHMKTRPMDAIVGGSIFGGKGISLERDTNATFGGPTLSPTHIIGQMKLEGPPHFNGQSPTSMSG